MTLPAWQVLYEDADITVCIKPAGIASEDTPNGHTPGMPALLRARWGEEKAFVGIVHRLDTAVSGVMVYARTHAAAAGLSRQIEAAQRAYAQQDRGEAAPPPDFVKDYRAVLAGVPDPALPAEGTLRDWLFKDSRKGKVFAVSRPRKGVREAVLEYKILASAAGGTCSLAAVTLHTGRTHQIRVQFAARRHPLWGDGKYDSRQKGALALQSARLRFRHPITGRAMDFSAPMPDTPPWSLFRDMQENPPVTPDLFSP